MVYAGLRIISYLSVIELIIPLRRRTTVSLYDNMLVVRRGLSARRGDRITRYEAVKFTIKQVTKVPLAVIKVGGRGGHVYMMPVVYKVCVEGPSKNVYAEFYSREEAEKLADAVEKIWGIPKSYTLGGYELGLP